MNYTQSANFVVDAGTGFNRHEENAAIPTAVTEKDMNMLIWSLMEVVKAGGQAGVVFDETVPATYQVLLKAMKAAFGGNVTTINAANSPYVLTANNAGLVILDATAGNISATLPLANVLTVMRFNFVRTDATANTATINRAGADTIDGANSFTVGASYDYRTILASGGALWATSAAKATGTATAQCYLDKSALNLLLSRYNGRYVPIYGALQEIPAVGVSLAPTGLLASTLYYIYAYMAAGVMTLEASTTVHAVDATTGIKIKTGDATRTLVGAWRTAAAGVWSTIETEGASFFNRRARTNKTGLTTNRSVSGAAFIELNAETRNSFFTWADERPSCLITGGMMNATAGASCFVAIGWDGATREETGVRGNSPSASTRFPYAITSLQPDAGPLTEGIHYATLVVASDAGTTSTFEHTVGNLNTTVFVATRG